jgi:hypothetical protein
MVNGEWVMRDGRSTRIDEAALAAEVRAALQHYADGHEPHGLETARILAPYVRHFYTSWDAAEQQERHTVSP